MGFGIVLQMNRLLNLLDKRGKKDQKAQAFHLQNRKLKNKGWAKWDQAHNHH